MIIDCHGHFTTTPPKVEAWREAQISQLGAGPSDLTPEFDVSDSELIDAIESGQLAEQARRGIDLTLFSPRASWMGHHIGDERASIEWTRRQNDLVHRVCTLFPGRFAPVAQLPQSRGATLDASVRELRRCVEQMRFVGCNINPDPTGGSWSTPALSDPSWRPLWEAMEELDVPGMIHASSADLPSLHTTGSHYLAADTIAFMQALTSGFLGQHPGLRLVIPHGGGAVPYHWGRFRGMAQDEGWDFDATVAQVWFDTCVYHQPGIDLLLAVVPTSQVLFGSEMIGAVRSVDPATGRNWDDTGWYIERSTLDSTGRQCVYEDNARRVYPRLKEWIPT